MDAYFKKLWWLTKRPITVFKSQNVKKKKEQKIMGSCLLEKSIG